MIELKNICFSYGKTRILHDISFLAEDGICVGILGNNGVGKSSLITCINRIHTPSSGEILIDGRNTSDFSRNELAKTVAYVSQKNEITRMTVFDCILLGRKPYIKWAVSQEDLDLCEEMLLRINMQKDRLRYIDELSGGEVQKVMLARALVQQPRILLLDEPTSNLDPRNQYEMMALVQELARENNLTVLVVMHDLNLALRYCDKFYMLKNGRGYSYGDISVMTGKAISEVYEIHAEVAEINNRKTVIIG